MLQTLFSYLEAATPTVIYWQTELTKRPALGPDNQGEGEVDKANWLTEELKRIGFTNITAINCPDTRVPCGYRPNIAAKIMGKSTKTLWVIAHMDVVPVGDISLWHTDPFTVTVDGDFVIGRGVEDNQQAIVTALLAAQSLLANNIQPELSLGVLFVADEETGMQYGLPHVLQARPDLIAPEDLVLVPDMGNSEGTMVEISEKSCLWLKVTVNGKQCHASTPDKGINSLIVSSACVLAFQELYRKFREKNPLFSPSWSTFVPTKKEANVENINTIPGKDVFYLDCRVLPSYSLDDIYNESIRIAQEVATEYGAEITIDRVHEAQALRATPANSPVVVSLVAALAKHRGKTAILQGSGGQTVSIFLRNSGIDAAAWSTLMPNAHVSNERSSITNTILDAKIVTAMLFPSL